MALYTDDRGNRIYAIRWGTLDDFPAFCDLPTLPSAEAEREKWEMMHRIAAGYALVGIDDVDPQAADYRRWECGECHCRTKGRHYRPCSVGDAAERLKALLQEPRQG